ncbi:hypothetical protein ACWED2_10100 [Amycolatopsis sp. NPDC005003]
MDLHRRRRPGRLAAAGWFLLGARALQGIGAALSVPSSFDLISAQAEPTRRNK